MFENRRISQGPVDDYDAVIQIDFSEPWVVLVYHGLRNNNSEVLQSQCARDSVKIPICEPVSETTVIVQSSRDFVLITSISWESV